MTTDDSYPARPRRRQTIWLALALALAAGCEEPEAISHYETPRTGPRAAAVDADEVRGLLDHMFTAIVPAGDKAWFFKLVVPAAAADAVRQPFDDFIAAVDAKPDAALPEWTLPEGWTVAAGGNDMRAATITIPHGEDKFEITVSTLPLVGKWPAFLQVNVDRWMDQLDQPHLAAATIAKLARTIPTQRQDATAFELVGKMRSTMGLPGGMPAGHPPLDGSTATASAPAAASVDGAARSASPGKLAYEAPSDWKPGTMVVMGMAREAAFVIPTDDGQAELAITKFPATGAMAELEPNVRRWAGQVGVVTLTADDITDAAERIEVDGAPALRFEFNSPAGVAAPQSIVAVMAKRGGYAWFIKLWGPRPAVESQHEALDRFLKSIKFNES